MVGTYVDSNRNGFRDPDEIGIPGNQLTVSELSEDGSQGSPIKLVTTNDNPLTASVDEAGRLSLAVLVLVALLRGGPDAKRLFAGE